MMPPLHAAIAHVVTGTSLPRSQDEIRADLAPDYRTPNEVAFRAMSGSYSPSPADQDAEEAHRASVVRYRAFGDMEQAIRSCASPDALEACWERVKAVSGWEVP